MQAIILAGGLGTRLRPLTHSVPKPMAPIRGAPYLEYQLRMLQRQSITDVVLCTGYLGEQIEHYFGDGNQLCMSLRYSQEPQPLGTGGALKLAAPLIAAEFLLLYGDSYLPIDYRAPWNFLQDSRATGLMVIYNDRHGVTEVPPNIAMDETGFIRVYDKDRADPAKLTYIEAGALVFRRKVLDLIPSEAIVSLEKDIYPALIQDRQLMGYQTPQRFYDIGTPQRLQVLEDLFRDHH